MMSRTEFTNLEKIFFPKTKITKGDLIGYYQSVAELMLPYLKDRPHSLKRQPDGIKGESFFQKNIEEAPSWVKTVKLHSESTDEDVNYLVCADQDHLLYMVQLGCIEINPWNSRIGNLDHPDWLILDLDPEDIGFSKVVETAQAIHEVCDGLGIPTYPKTSGKRGVHIYIPLESKYTYKQVRNFAKTLAKLANQKLPEVTSLERYPDKRKKKVYIDYLQNGRGQTLAAPYSVRPTPDATVSTPLRWDEVNAKLNPSKFTIKNTQKRIDKIGDLWKPVIGKGVNIKETLSKLE